MSEGNLVFQFISVSIRKTDFLFCLTVVSAIDGMKLLPRSFSLTKLAKQAPHHG